MTAEERRALRVVMDTTAPHSHAEQAPDPARLLEYDPEFLSCRDVMHTWPDRRVWRWKQVTDEQGRTVAYSRAMMCTRCSTIARDVINARNGASVRTYHWPEGYSMPKGQAVTKRDVRMEQLRRVSELFAAGELEDDEITAGERREAQEKAQAKSRRRQRSAGGRPASAAG